MMQAGGVRWVTLISRVTANCYTRSSQIVRTRTTPPFWCWSRKSGQSDRGFINTGAKSFSTSFLRLMSSEQMVNELQKSKQQKKKRKTLKLGSKISDHDLIVKVKNINTWLEKGQIVTVLIKNMEHNSKRTSEVFHEITSATHDLATVKNANNTNDHLQFVLQPRSLKDMETTSKSQKPLTMDQLKTIANHEKKDKT